MKVGKPISKRTSTRLRNKIQKGSNEKQRKLRKAAKNVSLSHPSTIFHYSSHHYFYPSSTKTMNN
jgi:hypothetical protein